MSFLHLVRRTHLYLGLFLLPWVIMFGVSSIPLNHNSPAAPPVWTKIAEVPFSTPVPPTPVPSGPAGNEQLRGLGREMMNAAGMSGGFYINRPNARQINVNHPNFLSPSRIFYYVDEQKLVAERRAFVPRMFVTSLHTRGGYNLGGFWDAMWAVFVDLSSLGLLVWIASGVIMWWKIPGTGPRRWGWLALGGGAICFVAIMLQL
jgi:hypothetical protein